MRTKMAAARLQPFNYTRIARQTETPIAMNQCEGKRLIITKTSVVGLYSTRSGTRSVGLW